MRDPVDPARGRSRHDDQPVMVRDGVTETYLRHMLGFWRATIARVEKSIEKHADAADRRTLN